MLRSYFCLRQNSRKTYPDWPHVPNKPFYNELVMHMMNSCYAAIWIVHANVSNAIVKPLSATLNVKVTSSFWVRGIVEFRIAGDLCGEIKLKASHPISGLCLFC